MVSLLVFYPFLCGEDIPFVIFSVEDLLLAVTSIEATGSKLGYLLLQLGVVGGNIHFVFLVDLILQVILVDLHEDLAQSRLALGRLPSHLFHVIFQLVNPSTQILHLDSFDLFCSLVVVLVTPHRHHHLVITLV